MFFSRQTGGASWLIVGLGNPGEKYEDTRHNVGFQVVDELAERQNAPVQKLKFKALTNLLTISGERVLVMKPVTYMNLSGEAVRPAADFYKIPPERILVISDDTALDPGKLRIRQKGSAGGHNGLKNIIQHLGTDQFPRVRVGVGQIRPGRLGAGQVPGGGQKGHGRGGEAGRRRRGVHLERGR